jgi:hypothetical protein
MKQYRITSENIKPKEDIDCYIDPTDPMYELVVAEYMGGLGSEQRLVEYRAQQTQINNISKPNEKFLSFRNLGKKHG